MSPCLARSQRKPTPLISDRSTTSAAIEELLPSWKISLTAEDKSPATITSYFLAATQLVELLDTKNKPTDIVQVTHREIQAFIAYVLEDRVGSGAFAHADPDGRNTIPGRRTMALESGLHHTTVTEPIYYLLSEWFP